MATAGISGGIARITFYARLFFFLGGNGVSPVRYITGFCQEQAGRSAFFIPHLDVLAEGMHQNPFLISGTSKRRILPGGLTGGSPTYQISASLVARETHGLQLFTTTAPFPLEPVGDFRPTFGSSNGPYRTESTTPLADGL
ncbi:hypothetical protein VTJ04DRAFT_2899 [Mycothermus thermophilus]|uniref:uncharacterized protein n=1 Tax=Humicola insolens TaxID=85995 RepID=UPI00374394DD